MVQQQYFAIIPASGLGQRLGGNIPKQYLSVEGKTIIEHTLTTFVNCQKINKIMVGISANDTTFASLDVAHHPKVESVIGGNTRFETVLHVLKALSQKANNDDWVIVHDAVRPCLHPNDLNSLLTQLQQDLVGGILAMPVADTLKRSENNKNSKHNSNSRYNVNVVNIKNDENINNENKNKKCKESNEKDESSQSNHIQDTLVRDNLWHALTPQVFRYQKLFNAMKLCHQKEIIVTDDAAAMEIAGYKPKLINAKFLNPKLTYEHDLKLISFLLKSYQKEDNA